MSNNNKDINTNVNRAEKREISKEKYTETQNSFRDFKNSLVYISATSDNTMNVSESSYHQEEYLKANRKDEAEYDRSSNLKLIDSESWKSEFNSTSGNIKPWINFFSLPKYGISEKSTQTMLRGQDLDDLDFLRRELVNRSTELLKSRADLENNKLPFFYERKCDDFSVISDYKNHFINIKRRNVDDFFTIKKQKNLTESNLRKTSNPHIHLKNKGGPRRKKKFEEKQNNQNKLSEESVFSKNSNDSSKKVLQIKSEDDDIAGIINDIKNSTKKETNKVYLIFNLSKILMLHQKKLEHILLGNLMLINFLRLNMPFP
jgi:hypothetical protein